MLKFDLDEFEAKKTPDDQIEVVETDSPTFNKMLGGGLRTGNLYVLQAKSGEGKTTFMMRLFINCLLAGKKVAFISAGEQSAQEIICRIACMYYRISYESYEFDNTDEQCEKINEFVEKYKDLMYVYYSEDLLLVRTDENGQGTNDLKEFFIEISKESAFRNYLIFGGMPFIFNFDLNLDKEACFQYLNDIYDSIILKDIVQRNKIRDVELLKRVILYVMANIGNTFSAQNITKFLKNEKRSVSQETIYNYIDYDGHKVRL